MQQLNIDGTIQDVTPKQYTPEQLAHALKTDYGYTQFSCGQDRTQYTAADNLIVRHVSEWRKEWYTIENWLTDESITTLNIADATRLLNEFLAEV